MLTVPEVARRVRRDPETVRRWIRSGKLRARKIGTQHFVEEDDLAAATAEAEMLQVPKSWGWDRTFDGKPMPNVVEWIRRSREAH
ncbi:MAG: helix-turn-helix domain-containing protein [Chloroflexota bacterium]|nr:helix-turn-helix domain-containing protein [Chloroflexota bacterium]